MATSTPQKRHKVKVLFYGQSITKSGWVPATEAYLKSTFPHADFDIREEAVGGFGARGLLRTAEHDVIPWYPDLMIFHSYGSYADIDAFMQFVRRRTTTEIMLQTNHVGTHSTPRADRQNLIVLPHIASRLGLHIVEVSGPWKAYLERAGKSPQDLILPPPDDIHPNDEGKALYAKITNDQLKIDPGVLVDPLSLVTTYEVGKDVVWKGNSLRLRFDGNRVVLEARAGMIHPPDTVRVLVDGKKPSEFVGAYAITRPNGDVDSDWPWTKGSVTRVTMDPSVQPRAEEWTMTLTTVNKAGECTFTLFGSVTGPDGGGTCNQRFTSVSKRMVIDSSDYFFGPPQDPLGPIKTTIPVGHTVKWKVYELHHDSYPPAEIDASDIAQEYLTTIVQGLRNGEHTLELNVVGGSTLGIEAIRVYRPPLR